MKNGFGIYYKKNGSIIEGQWINDTQNGNFIIIKADGTRT